MVLWPLGVWSSFTQGAHGTIAAHFSQATFPGETTLEVSGEPTILRTRVLGSRFSWGWAILGESFCRVGWLVVGRKPRGIQIRF